MSQEDERRTAELSQDYPKGRRMSLAEWIEAQTYLCTHIIVVRNDVKRVEAILNISPDILKTMQLIWTEQYYMDQADEASANRTKKQEYLHVRNRSRKAKARAKGVE